MIHQHRAIARLLDFCENMAAHQDEGVPAHIPEQGPEGRCLHRIQPGTRFIEQHHPRTVNQTRGQAGALTEARAERTAQSVLDGIQSAPREFACNR